MLGGATGECNFLVGKSAVHGLAMVYVCPQQQCADQGPMLARNDTPNKAHTNSLYGGICIILQASMNGIHQPKGCPGAVFSNGALVATLCFWRATGAHNLRGGKSAAHGPATMGVSRATMCQPRGLHCLLRMYQTSHPPMSLPMMASAAFS